MYLRHHLWLVNGCTVSLCKVLYCIMVLYCVLYPAHGMGHETTECGWRDNGKAGKVALVCPVCSAGTRPRLV